MNPYFQAERRASAVDLVVNHIKQLLMERKLNPNDRLPTELEISEGMGVSRGSVREAMKILSAFGLVDIRVGNGTYVSDRPGNNLMDTFLFSFYLSNPNLEDMYELRVFFEIDVLQSILKHRSENAEERALLGENLNQLKEYIKNQASSETLLENDIEFHRIMGKASCNILMERIYNFIIDILRPSIQETHKGQRGELILESHQRIYDVIENNDVTRVSDAITASINVWSSRQS